MNNNVIDIANKNKEFFHELTKNYEFCFSLIGNEVSHDDLEIVESLLGTFPLGKEEIPVYLCGYYIDENDENSESCWFLVTNSSIYSDSYEELVVDLDEIFDVTVENNQLCLYFERDGETHKWELAPEWITGYANAQMNLWKDILLSFIEASKSNNQDEN